MDIYVSHASYRASSWTTKRDVGMKDFLGIGAVKIERGLFFPSFNVYNRRVTPIIIFCS